MFESVRLLKNSNSNSASVAVFNEDKQLIANDTDKAGAVRDWFEQHYLADEPPLEPFTGSPRPLNVPILPGEVEAAAKRLKNGKAVGPDNIPNANYLNMLLNNFTKCMQTLLTKHFRTTSMSSLSLRVI